MMTKIEVLVETLDCLGLGPDDLHPRDEIRILANVGKGEYPVHIFVEIRARGPSLFVVAHEDVELGEIFFSPEKGWIVQDEAPYVDEGVGGCQFCGGRFGQCMPGCTEEWTTR